MGELNIEKFLTNLGYKHNQRDFHIAGEIPHYVFTSIVRTIAVFVTFLLIP